MQSSGSGEKIVKVYFEQEVTMVCMAGINCKMQCIALIALIVLRKRIQFKSWLIFLEPLTYVLHKFKKIKKKVLVEFFLVIAYAFPTDHVCYET